MNFKNFLEKQNQIYADFKLFEANAEQSGVVIPAVDSKIRKGFIIAFRFDENLVEIQNKVSEIFKNTPYKPLISNVLHSTITVYKENLSKEDLSIIKDLSGKHLNLLTDIQFEFTEIFFNADSVILSSYPNAIYWDFCKKIVGELNEQTQKDFRFPKMAHVTLARVNNKEEQTISKEKIKQIAEELKNLNLPFTLSPIDLHIGFFEHTREGIKFSKQTHSP